ncbi:putative oxidoreductase [Metarhizium anisopliae]
MSTILVVGATRGLGASLVKQYAATAANVVYGTARSNAIPSGFPEHVKWLNGVDLTKSSVGDDIVRLLGDAKPLSTLIITAGHFSTEDISAEKGPNWHEELQMYTTSSVAPVFIVHRLVHAGLLHQGSKVILVSSEAGSIGLRHEKEGGGNYAHHASKSALNMVGKLLSLDLKEKGVIISIVHPGFMRTDMTKGVGYDKYWDAGGAVTSDEAASTLIQWTDHVDISKTGEYWAPRGPGQCTAFSTLLRGMFSPADMRALSGDIGTAEETMGKNLETPLHLPW